MKQFTKGFQTAFAVLGCVLAFSSVRAEENFSFKDIHYWIGEGTNRAAVVIDWNNGKPNSSLAWGIRWNGGTTNLTSWLQRLASEDRRLEVLFSGGVEHPEVHGFAYDADGDGGIFDLSDGAATDSDDFIAVAQAAEFWAGTKTNGFAFTVGSEWTVCVPELNARVPTHGDWFGFRFVSGTEERKTPALPRPAESPYAVEVVANYTNLDEFSGSEYATPYPETVLGRPSSYCPGWEYDGYIFPDVNITPHSQAFGTNQVFSMASLFDENNELLKPGSVTIKFDHKVLDDPQNPFGLDFIVFGNAFLYMDSLQYFDGMGDPNLYFDETSVFGEKPGLVEVSQDGINWFAYEEGPYANTFSPTISHLYDTNSPDASLFAGNQWWGKLADPTLPVDPSLMPSDFLGRSIAEYATLFNGSSGGVGFDIGEFSSLLVDEATGLKWIQYVRVTTLSNYDDAMWTVIDAFADVAPALPYDNWVRGNYDWTQLPNTNIVGKGVIAANGKPNFYNAVFGTASDGTPVESFAISSFTSENGKAVFRVPSAEYAFDAFRIGKASTLGGLYRNSLPTYEGTFATETGFESVFSVPVDNAATNAFYKVGIVAE